MQAQKPSVGYKYTKLSLLGTFSFSKRDLLIKTTLIKMKNPLVKLSLYICVKVTKKLINHGI